MRFFNQIIKDQRGAATLEWASIAKFSVVCIVSLAVNVAPGVNGSFNDTADAFFGGNSPSTQSLGSTDGHGRNSGGGDQTLGLNNGGGSQEGTIQANPWANPWATTPQTPTNRPADGPSLGRIFPG